MVRKFSDLDSSDTWDKDSSVLGKYQKYLNSFGIDKDSENIPDYILSYDDYHDRVKDYNKDKYRMNWEFDAPALQIYNDTRKERAIYDNSVNQGAFGSQSSKTLEDQKSQYDRNISNRRSNNWDIYNNSPIVVSDDGEDEFNPEAHQHQVDEELKSILKSDQNSGLDEFPDYQKKTREELMDSKKATQSAVNPHTITFNPLEKSGSVKTNFQPGSDHKDKEIYKKSGWFSEGRVKPITQMGKGANTYVPADINQQNSRDSMFLSSLGTQGSVPMYEEAPDQNIYQGGREFVLDPEDLESSEVQHKNSSDKGVLA